MIEKLTLEDFQTHTSRVVQLNNPITVIVGDTDVGKSSIMRAVAWLVFNKPDSDAFINWDATKTTVTLKVDGRCIIRERGKGVNTYQVDDVPYKAFGRDVPEEVSQLLRLGPVNFQFQHDASFWFSQSAGEVSRQLNHIIDLSVIDNTLSDIAAKLRQVQERVSVSDQRAKELKVKHDTLKPITETDAALVGVESAHDTLERTVQQKQRLSKIIVDTEGNQQRSREAQAFVKAASQVTQAAETFRIFKNKADLLHDLILTVKSFKQKAEVALPDFSKLTKAKAESDRATAQRKALEATYVNAYRNQTVWNTSTIEAKRVHQLLHEKTEGRCVLCGHTIP